jgi:hypothetical protein
LAYHAVESWLFLHPKFALLNSSFAAITHAGLVSSQQMPKAIGFISRHPDALGTMMNLSAAATIGEQNPQLVGTHS